MWVCVCVHSIVNTLVLSSDKEKKIQKFFFSLHLEVEHTNINIVKLSCTYCSSFLQCCFKVLKNKLMHKLLSE